mmetsp:Transcript_7789/g.32076  ORF Transcript_7789/g.32076 Transcript_7789/m.32076 type:complete len:207 (-) Transcript_7789:258-878(-)
MQSPPAGVSAAWSLHVHVRPLFIARYVIVRPHVVVALPVLPAAPRRVRSPLLHQILRPGVLTHQLPHLSRERVWFAEHERSRVAVERVRGVRIEQELREEDLEDVHQVEHRRPRLVDDVQTHAPRALVDIWVVHPVHKSDARGLVRVPLGQLDVNLPHASLVRRVRRAVEVDVKLLHRVVHQLHLVVAHHQLSDVHLASLEGRTRP